MKISLNLKLTLTILFSSFILCSQAKDKNAIPKKVRKSYSLLAQHLTAGMQDDTDKADTIYGWITHNIAYDYNRLSADKFYQFEAPNKTLKKKKGLSMDFAQLFTVMLGEVGIASEQVEGYMIGQNRDDSLVLNKTSHRWVTANINDKWFMFDPAMDAGYIGRIPYEYKAPKKKSPLILKTQKRVKRFDARYQKRLKNYNQKIKDSPKYKDEIDFIQSPKKIWFMPETDSFLLTHLPAVKFWQLRDNPISPEDFLMNEEKLKDLLGETAGSYDYKGDMAVYLELDQLDQLIFIAEEGYEFNSRNPGLKAINYFNYVNVLNSKELKPYFTGVPERYTKAIYKQMLTYVDTIEVYNKLDFDQQKRTFKLRKKLLKDTYKNTKESNKLIVKSATNGNKAHNKTLSLLDKSSEKLSANNEKIVSNIEKIKTAFPQLVSQDYKAPDPKPIQAWKDSVDVTVAKLDSLILAVNKSQRTSALENVYKEVQQTEHLMRLSSHYISQNDLEVNRYIQEVDSLIILQLDSLNTSYKVLVESELIEKQAMELLKQIKYAVKMAKIDAKTLLTNKEIVSAVRYDKYMNSLYLNALEKVLKFNTKNLSHIDWLADNFEYVDDTWSEIMEHVDEQEVLNEEKNTYMKDHYEHGFNRGESLFQEMTKSVKQWSKEFEKVISE